MEEKYSPKQPSKVPEVRYAYYRRCQVFRNNGEQCKAPAEKGSPICYAHAREQATALRRKIELSILLAEVVRRMRARGKPEFEIADIFMDFDAIQVTLGVMAQALIDGRIDCKTAGRLAVGLQTAAKMLRLYHRVHRGTQRKESLAAKDTKGHEGGLDDRTIGRAGDSITEYCETFQTIERQETAAIALMRADHGRAHAPPEWARAA
jgi:hypothetical protein